MFLFLPKWPLAIVQAEGDQRNQQKKKKIKVLSKYFLSPENMWTAS